MQRINHYIRSIHIPKIIWGIFFIALFLRFWGIWYGLPLQLNIDEPSLVSGTLTLKHSLNPGRFDWPSLYFYINAIFYGLLELLRPAIISIFHISEDSFSPASFFIVSRALSAVLGSLTILIIYLITRRIFSHKVGIIAAIILTFLPVHVYESHLAKIDIAHTFFVAIAVYYIWMIYKSGDKWAYVMSGIAIGVATSIKYNSFLLALSVLIAYLLRRSEVEGSDLNRYWNTKGVKYMLLSGIISIVVFYMGTPFGLIDYKTFFSSERGQGAMWQFQNVGQVEWPNYPFEVYGTFVTMFREDLGYIVWILFSLLLIAFTFFNKRSKEYIFLLAPTVIIALYISKLDRSPSHYFLMLIPFYVPALANFINEIYEKIKTVPAVKLVPLQVWVMLILLPSIFAVFKSDYMLARLDTRNLAYNWTKQNLDPNSDFLYVIGEDLDVVQFQRNNTSQLKKLDRDNIKDGPPAPFFVLIGVQGIKEEQLTTGDRDPGNLEGNSEPILKYADLLYSVQNDLRFGPPIYIFKVNQVQPEK